MSANHSSAPFLQFAKIVLTLMHQVLLKSARGTNAKIISSANNRFVIKDTVMYKEVEIGEEEETMAFKYVSFSP